MKIAFYTEPAWALGAITTGLIKELHKWGISGHLLSWSNEYSPREWELLNKTYDRFVVTPCLIPQRLIERGIPQEKIVVISHGRTDFHYAKSCNYDWNKFAGIAAISPMLVQHAKEMGVDREVKLVQNGIDFDFYYQEPNSKLQNIGYGGTWEYINHFESKDNLKRPHLVQSIVDQTNLNFVKNTEKLFYQCMPAYYKSIDALIMPTNEQEACGLPIMEAAAAGRVVLSASVGIVDHLKASPGFILPLEEDKFIERGIATLKSMQTYPQIYNFMCKKAQDFARSYYDWSVVVNGWIDVITK